MVQLFYTTYISVDLAQNEKFRAIGGKCVIIMGNYVFLVITIVMLNIFYTSPPQCLSCSPEAFQV